MADRVGLERRVHGLGSFLLAAAFPILVLHLF